MKKKDLIGIKFEEYPEYEDFIKLMKKEKVDYQNGGVLYTRHTSFIPDGKPSCIICGGNKLIHGMGRYVLLGFDDEGEPKVIGYICGFCESYLEEHWEIEMDMD